MQQTVSQLIVAWLGYDAPTETIDPVFWAPSAGPGPLEPAYLQLLLVAVTNSHPPLVAAFMGSPEIPNLPNPPFVGADTVAKLVADTDEGWRELFLGLPTNFELLPPFTERIGREGCRWDI